MKHTQKVPNHVWYKDKLWKVEKILRPTKYDVYLLLSRETEFMYQGNVHDVDMRAVHVLNECVYPDTKKVRALIQRKEKLQKQIGEIFDALYVLAIDEETLRDG